ncbi:hypothetical protein PFISCL1PPCAC_3595, partial [Pristionchus fissidentatus]
SSDPLTRIGRPPVGVSRVGGAMARHPVRINVYDMYWLNDYASNIGVGIFHTGIEIYGVEYAYGGHPYPFSGIFENSPQDAEELGENFKFKESILIGETDFYQKDVRDLIKALGMDFRGDRYHLISRNCNHFAGVLAKTLTGKEIPSWINRLASISGSIPFLERCLPQEWLTPVALQNSLDERKGSRGSIDSAEEARETSARSLNDSRTTVLNGRASSGLTLNGSSHSPVVPFSGAAATASSTRLIGNGGSVSAPVTARGDRDSSPGPSIVRFWNQIKGTMVGPDQNKP